MDIDDLKIELVSYQTKNRQNIGKKLKLWPKLIVFQKLMGIVREQVKVVFVQVIFQGLKSFFNL